MINQFNTQQKRVPLRPVPASPTPTPSAPAAPARSAQAAKSPAAGVPSAPRGGSFGASPAYGQNTYLPSFLTGQATLSSLISPPLSYGGPAYRLGASAIEARQGALGIFQEGIVNDLAGANQFNLLSGYLHALNDGQMSVVAQLLNAAGSKSEQVFILKAFAAGEPWDAIVTYANEMRGFSEAEIVRRSTMRDSQDVIQQWQDACGPTLAQTLAGEADPRYAWELNKLGDLSAIDPNGANRDLASQQRQWLEAYGGVAVERGQTGGQGIALSELLNNTAAPLLHISYAATPVSEPAASFNQMANLLQAGYDVPLRITWSRPGAATDNGHFMLALAVRGTPGARELQIHDPWSGKTGWVSEQSFMNDSIAPISDAYAHWTHFYAAQPQ